jgi:Cu-Zn family superoxide dismutase
MKKWQRMFVAGVVTIGAMAAQAQAPVKVTMKTSDGKDAGTVTLKQGKNGVKVTAKLKNLPIGDHAIHVHAVAKCDPPDFKTAGPHLNPAGKKHGLKNPEGPHAGDFPKNLTVGPDGTVDSTFVAKGISLDPAAPNSVFANGGTSIVVHEKADDMMTDPSGNSGNRIACGVVTR